jgi:hypothetical protein
VTDSRMEQGLRDNGGRRSGVDRRQFLYTDHIPERRAREDRRSRVDRRCGEDRRNQNDQTVEMNRRSGLDRRAAFQM